MHQNITTRRHLLATVAGLSATGLAGLPRLLAAQPAAPSAASGRRIPQHALRRVIVDNDFAGDPDGLLAAAHQLLSPSTEVPLLSASALMPQLKLPGVDMQASADASAAMARQLLARLGLPGPAPRVVAGSNRLGDLGPSAAAVAIVEEARREHRLPLFLTCGGPLTNVAAALRLAPDIAQRMTVVWIGGGTYPDGGWEYNLNADLDAARLVFEHTTVPLWQVPQSTYRQVQMSLAELAADLQPISPFSAWLYERFTQPPDFVQVGGAWPQGDSPLVLLTALSDESSRWRELPAPRFGPDGRHQGVLPERRVRVIEQVDTRLMLADLLARLRLHPAR